MPLMLDSIPFHSWTVSLSTHGQYSLSTEMLIFPIASILFISVSILWEFAMLPDMYIGACAQRCIRPSEGTNVHIWQHINQKDYTLFIYYVSIPW